MYLCIEVQAKITVTTPKIAFHLVNGCYCHNHCMLDNAPNLEKNERRMVQWNGRMVHA